MVEPAFDIKAIFNEDYLYFYADRLGDARSDADVDLIERLGPPTAGAEILDLACGHGRIANRLAQRGCRVTGVDAVASFLDRAREDADTRGVAVDYVLADMRDLPWTGRFDAVVCWFTAFGYFDDSDNRRVLREMARVLRPGGTLLLDVVHYTYLVREHLSTTVVERDGDLLLDRHHLDPIAGRTVVERTIIRDGNVRHRIPWFVRLFTFTELRDWLLAAGFGSVDGYGEDGAPLTADSARMILVATVPTP